MTSTATNQDPMVKRLLAIEALIQAGKLPDAAQKLNAAVKSSPGDPRVYLLGSRLAEAAGNPKGAEQAARRAVELTPDWPVAVTELAFLLARQNQFKDAITFAQRAVQLDGDNPEVLGRAIDIAHRAQHMDLATLWLDRAVALDPDNLHIQHQLARDMRLKGEHERAVAAYDALIAASPSDVHALLGRIQSHLATANPALALQDCETLLALDPANEEYRFWQALAQGRTPSRQPVTMVRDLYEGFADLYDQHVVAGLKYKLPREVGRIINGLYPDNTLNVLDLGCGTGLLGACLGRIHGALIGVEISPKMIQQAGRHGVYDRFHNVDLVEALQETPASLYDVIAALDVFIYVGDLTGSIPDAHRILKDGGRFIFSCETAGEDEQDLVLRPSQRYAHKASSIEALCRAAGFEQVSLQPQPLRYENNEPVPGFLVIAKKAG